MTIELSENVVEAIANAVIEKMQESLGKDKTKIDEMVAKIHSVIDSTPISFSYGQANDYLHLEISRTIYNYLGTSAKESEEE